MPVLTANVTKATQVQLTQVDSLLAKTVAFVKEEHIMSDTVLGFSEEQSH